MNRNDGKTGSGGERYFSLWLWFNLRQQPRPTQPLTHPCTSRNGGRTRRVKARKLLGEDKDTYFLKGKAKAIQKSKAKEGINSLLPTGRQEFSHPQESRASPCATVTWEDKHCHAKYHPLPPSSPSSTCEHNAVWCGISLWSVGVGSPRYSPQSLVHPHPLGGGEVRGRKDLDAA